MKWKDFLYLEGLYFRRGKLISIFYFIMLTLGILLPGILLETSSKMSQLLDNVQDNMPPYRLKVSVPPHIRTEESKTRSLLQDFLGRKKKESSAQPKTAMKYKDFLDETHADTVQSIDGVQKLEKLYTIDFPTGIVFSIPGLSTPIQSQIIGIGVEDAIAREYIHPASTRKDFRYEENKPVPVMLASFILPIINSISESNGSKIEISPDMIIGTKIRLFVGRSSLAKDFSRLGNGAKETFSEVDQANFSEDIVAEIVGYIDMDYTFGLAFPAEFIAKYKAQSWGNFSKGQTFDEFLIQLDSTQVDKVISTLEEQGYQVSETSGIRQKLTTFLNKQSEGTQLFLQVLSWFILTLTFIILFYTILWMLRGKSTEFLVYEFFALSKHKVFFLYTQYLRTLNVLGLVVAQVVLFFIKSYLKHLEGVLITKIPEDFSFVLNNHLLDGVPVAMGFAVAMYLAIEIIGNIFTWVYIYKINLKHR